MRKKKLLIGMIVGRYYATRPDGKPDYLKIDEYIRLAEKYAVMLWDNGFGAFTPHLNTCHFEVKTSVSEAVYQEFDREMLKKVDFVFLLQNWRESAGAQKEVRMAMKLGKPIFASLENLKKWREKILK